MNHIARIQMGFFIGVVVFLSALRATRVHGLNPRCGDCWCISYGEANECPDAPSGISDTFSESFAIFDTFNLTNGSQEDNPYLYLRTDDGEECYPFANTLGGPLNGYPKSSLPQCAISPQTFDTVCAYKYDKGVECSGRNYEIVTYNSTQEAEDDGAVVTHSGACGVCSSAKDLWARMRTIDEFETETLVCATIFILNPDSDEEKFDALVQCAIKAGMSPECALLYAHLGAATASDCGGACSANALSGSIVTNEPAPSCALSSCFECPTSWNMFFDELAGRTMERSGITENTAKRCSAFSSIMHDPCAGALNTAEQAMSQTNATSISSSSSSNSSNSFLGDTMILVVTNLVAPSLFAMLLW